MTLPNIWPVSPVQLNLEGEGVDGISPIPIIWVIGGPETGKTTFVATVDPVRPGQETHTLILDFEQSATTLRTMVPLEVVDIRALADARVNQLSEPGKRPPFQLTLFEAAHDFVLNYPPGVRTVLAFDPSSDFKIGSNLWTRAHPELFGKVAASYSGKEGAIYSWGDTAVYLKDFFTKLAAKFQTVVLTSHEMDEFKEGRRTGNKEPRSTDFTELVTLKLWLQKEGAKRFAVVHKSRLSWFDWGDEAAPRQRPLLRDLLPKRLEALEAGQSYPELIAYYLTHPERDYGTLNLVQDPAKRPLTVDERTLLETQKAEAEAEALRLKLEEATNAGKRKLMVELKQAGLTQVSGLEVAQAFGALGVEQYTLNQHEDILRRLVTHFQQAAAS